MALIELLAEGEGLADVEVIRLAPGSVVREIIVAVAAKGGFSPDEAFVFLEDGDEPLDVAAIILEEHAHRIHHVHRRPRVDVRVFYKNDTILRPFRPSARIQRVLDWAVGSEGFKIDPPLRPEMELAIHGTTTELPKSAHLGRYVRHDQPCLELDLIRGVIPNGRP